MERRADNCFELLPSPAQGLPSEDLRGLVRSETELVPIHTLLPADSPRLSGEDREHATMLAGISNPLPPIVVHRSSLRVIDGMYRLRAAVLRGEDNIAVLFFDGGEADAFRLAVTLNVTHGLPLTLADRRAAASRILRLEPHLSDRAIARTAGLSPKTVSALRQQCVDDNGGQDNRIGRDGRTRPVNSAHGRRVASMLFAERPNASLREIARSAGISPATARDVRVRLSRDDDPVPPRLREAEQALHFAAPVRDPDPVDERRKQIRPAHRRRRNPGAVLSTLRNDPALRFTDSGRAILKWLAAHIVDLGSCEELAFAVPAHSAGLVAQLARDCAAEWISMANRLESGHCAGNGPDHGRVDAVRDVV